MKRISIFIILSMTFATSFAWSSKGHQIVAYIAKRHLNPYAYDRINEILDNESIVYYASWLDRVVNDPEYSYTSTWHWVNVDPGQTLENRTSLEYDDGLVALHRMINDLDDPATSLSDRQFAIKVITHVVGDLHQPMHTGRGYDSGGNSHYIYYNDKRISLHKFWDSYVVDDSHPWSYYEWQQGIDNATPEEEAEIVEGTIEDWVWQTVSIMEQVYEEIPKYASLTTADVARWTPVAELQLLRGGLRLAHIFNSVLGSDYSLIESIGETDRQESPAVYNLQGIMVAPAGGAHDSLAPGLYLQSDGKKLLVR